MNTTTTSRQQSNSVPRKPGQVNKKAAPTVMAPSEHQQQQQQQREEFKDDFPKMIRGEKRYTEEYCASIMVTGGCGFVGSHIVDALLGEGRYVVIYDMFNSETSSCQEKRETADFLQQQARTHASLGAQLTIVEGNIRDPERIAQVVREHQVTACIHMAGLVDDRRSVHHAQEYLENNVLGTSCLLDTLGKCGVKMVVQPSTRSVFGANDQSKPLVEGDDRRPINPYGASKVATDALGHCYSYLHDMNVTLIRIFATYGPRGRPDMLPRILAEAMVYGKPIKKFGDGTATRTWTYITDVVRAIVLALKHPQGGFDEFHTGAPNITTLNEMIACVEQVSGKTAIIHHYPTPPGDPAQVGHPNYDKIKREMNWEPQVTVLEGMRMVYEYYAAKAAKENAQVVKVEQEPQQQHNTTTTTTKSHKMVMVAKKNDLVNNNNNNTITCQAASSSSSLHGSSNHNKRALVVHGPEYVAARPTIFT